MAVLSFKKEPNCYLRWSKDQYGFLILELVSKDGSKETIRIA